jgi:hypothetical protein
MSLLQRTLLRSLALGAGAVLWAGTAFAVNFNGSYSVSLHTSTSLGVGLSETDINQPVFNLANAGDSALISPLFKINVLESCCTGDDLTGNPISVTFNFTQPTGGNGAPLTGTSQGHFILHAPDTVTVTWDAPVTFTFGGGISLQIALTNLTITCKGSGDDDEGEDGCKPYSVKDNPECEHRCSTHTVYTSGDIDGKFTLLNLPPVVGDAPVVTPLPAALPLFLSGAGMIGLLARRRKRKSTTDC